MVTLPRHTIYWLTGLPCSGKTSIAQELSKQISAEVIDGDALRFVTKNNNFSLEFRALNIRYAGEMAYRLSAYVHVVVSLVSPIKSERDEIKAKYPNVIEVYVKCPLEICMQRDSRGMYARAMKGEIADFTGISQQYEEPENPAIVVETDKCSIDQCVERILEEHRQREKS